LPYKAENIENWSMVKKCKDKVGATMTCPAV